MATCQAITRTIPIHLEQPLLDNCLLLRPDGHVHWARGNGYHPRNWGKWRELYDTLLIIFLDFFTSSISTAGVCGRTSILPHEGPKGRAALPADMLKAPAADIASEEYGVDKTLAVFLFVSLYLVGQGIGSIGFPPYSESFGRKKLYIVSTGLYALFAVIIAAVPSIAAAAVGRFVTGFLSGIPTSIVAGSIEDMYAPGMRIWMIFAWAVAANVGIIVGPIFSIYISENLGWRWLFYITAIVCGIVTVLLVGIRESRPSQLLECRVSALRETTGDFSLRALNPDHTPDLKTFAKIGLFRPILFLLAEPIVILVSFMSATAFALIYLFTEALQVVYTSMGFTAKEATLPFLAAVIGVLCSSVTRVYDNRVYYNLCRRRYSVAPEDKLLGFSIGAPALVIGMWWFAWTIPPMVVGVNWCVSAVALVFVGYALNELDTVLGGYLVDSYTVYASSVWASASLTRTVLCATFPLFATSMFHNLGSNVAASILASIATIFCPCPWLFKRYGRRIRQKSKFAGQSLDVDEDEYSMETLPAFGLEH